MDFSPKPMKYMHKFKTIDSHTMGESTRIIYDGFPEIKGKTMMEKKKYLEQNYDEYRRALMLEPRGHKDMFGALLTEPVNSEADIGVIFMDSGGYLNMCGHGSMGVASMAVETGLVKVQEPYTEVVLEAPSGIIRTMVNVVNGKAVKVSILNVPSFLYKADVDIDIQGYGTITADISFGGSFFALVDAEKIGLELNSVNIDEIIDLGMKIRKKINDTIPIKHPYLDITTVDLVEFYSHTDNEKADMKNCVVFGFAQADRSPCGTGTSAKLATLFSKGKLGLNEPFVYESITGSLFVGEAVQNIEVSGKNCIIPKITGSAYITGMNTWLLDEDDPLEYGFLLGSERQMPEESIRARIVKAAWKLFNEKGYEETSVEDILSVTDMTQIEFNSEFAAKECLLDTLSDLFDEKYSELMLEMNPRFSHYEKLLYLNRELFAMIEKEIPFDMVAVLYVKNTEEKQLLNENRLYYKLILQIVTEGQKHGEFKSDISAEEMAGMYTSLERGMVYNWCVTDGKYSLEETGRRLLPIYLKEILL